MKAVVANFVELSAPAGVGAVGVPVSDGLSSLAKVLTLDAALDLVAGPQAPHRKLPRLGGCQVEGNLASSGLRHRERTVFR
jgi:hypothetical protein